MTLCSVQQKINCLFDTIVTHCDTHSISDASGKRVNQTFRVEASDNLRESAMNNILLGAVATEKLDGTCSLVRRHDGQLCLWARHDRKPNKAAEKRFKKYQNELGRQGAQQLVDKFGDVNVSENNKGDGKSFVWNISADLKDVPVDWIPATGSVNKDGVITPDVGGHVPGWVPVGSHSKQHCWHASVFCRNSGLALVLRPHQKVAADSDCRVIYDYLEITLQPLFELENCTFELIGTNINANPYKLGSRKHPFHVLVCHGSIEFPELPALTMENLRDWFINNRDGCAEGIVWHCSGGSMYKLHRHHVGLPWPIADLRLLSFPVRVNVNFAGDVDVDTNDKQLFRDLSRISGQTFESLDKIRFADE